MDGVAKDLLNPHVVCVTEDMGVHAVAQLLRDEAITGAPVVNDQGRVVGIISQSDLMSHDLATPPDARPAATVSMLKHQVFNSLLNLNRAYFRLRHQYRFW
jgi:CBS domain-containing protein